MGPTPDVSVIVTVYNGASYIERSLGSVLAQTLAPARMQVLIVDDGSTDESPAMLDRMAEANPSFEVVHQPNSGGPAGPRNRAMGQAVGRYLFFLDQDDHLAPETLESMVRIADANGTDVVLARTRGTGGRITPRPMFVRTVAHTDVFTTPSVYRLLNPTKLFRATMVRSLGLQFRADFHVGEDQPFVAMAYLKGNGISILADRDYVFWVNREDGSNITKSALALGDRMPVASHMVELVAENVPPGRDRDALMVRHFHIELANSAFVAWDKEPDPAVRAAAFDRFREIVAAYYTDRIKAGLPARARVLMHLVSEGRREEFAAYLEALAHTPEPAPLLFEGDRTYLTLPWFRDPTHALPDDLFDAASGLVMYRRVEPVGIGRAGIRITAVCRLGVLTDRITDVSLVARSRATGNEEAFPLPFEVSFEEALPFARVEGTIPAERLLTVPENDTCDLYMRVAAGETSRRSRVAECAPSSGLRIMRSRGRTEGTRYGVLSTNPTGHLVLTAMSGPTLARLVLRRFRRSIARKVRAQLGKAGA